MRICWLRLPLWSTSRAVITFVTLAMGRSVVSPRPHRIWPVVASARIAPLAFTPPGVPVTWITGPAGGRGLDVLTGWLARAVAAWLVWAVADLMAANGVGPDHGDVQAARPAARTGTG